MEQPSSRETGPKPDVKTVLFRVFSVFAYIAFGSGIFHFLESDAASLRVAKFEEFYNKTMADILSRCTSSETSINITMARIRQTFMQHVFPKEWDSWGGINITVQAMTTIGQYTFWSTRIHSLIFSQNRTRSFRTILISLDVKMQLVCWHLATDLVNQPISGCASHGWRKLVDDKSVASYQQTWSKFIVKTFYPQASYKLF